jgi:hypothetical protein
MVPVRRRSDGPPGTEGDGLQIGTFDPCRHGVDIAQWNERLNREESWAVGHASSASVLFCVRRS